MGYEKFYDARNIIEDFIIKDFIGPVEEDEIIEEFPSQYYSMGILFPQNTEIDLVDQITSIDSFIEANKILEDYRGGDVFEGLEQGLSLANMYKPSSMAISAKLIPNVREIKINIKYAKYLLIENNTEDIEVANINNALSQNDEDDERVNINEVINDSNKYLKDKWLRKYYIVERVVSVPQNRGRVLVDIEPGLGVELYTHLKGKEKDKNITIALINRNRNEKNLKNNDINSYFQVSMEIQGINEDDRIFSPKTITENIREYEEDKFFSMLYSHVNVYSSSFGCSVEELVDEKGCYKISTKTMPNYEMQQMESSIRTNPRIFQMEILAKAGHEEVVKLLNELVYSYKNWIKEQEKSAILLNIRYEEMAKKSLELCKESITRIQKSIDMLEDNTIFKSFQLANEAMLKQREDLLERGNKEYTTEDITWYPFQLAFLLQEISAIVSPEDSYRDVVDLLWFPTGGGKTEAYLGIAAFTIFYRRLRYGEEGAGVSIIMRYTLRLLTIQQFERSASLICACESLRKRHKLGGSEISIGLFVGSAMTPNNIVDAIEKLDKVKNNGISSVTEGNPVQLSKCPVCGTPLSTAQYNIFNNSLKINCANQNCEFNKGFPIYLVDEDLYRYKPTLILSTIDKFARMTWEPRVGQIFGINTIYRNPELIIQDELHLISGPLGTITGLYEVAIDYFCSEKGIKPKIVASTATIKHASSQVLSLYGREFRQFPPQGINIRDSYYAVEASSNSKPNRKYVGILSPHKTPATTLIRLYACLQFATRYLVCKGFDEEVIDNFWTLIGYFNTLRELGGALIQIYDNVQERYLFLKNSKFKNISPKFEGEKRYDNIMELTSRKKQAEITKALDDLAKTYSQGGAYDYVLASNMISVGIDFPRLGLMSITGQPKSNSEYIQASSRVGRKNPGMVFTIYNPSRSRDRSHYEQFYEYHSSIYKHVEANSLTPFSSRARERALSSIYISICRQIIEEIREKNNANNFVIDDNRLDIIEDIIINRAKLIVEDKNILDDILNEIDDIKLEWSKATNYGNLQYDKYTGNENTYPLLKVDKEDIGVFLTLNSMRNVDYQSNIYIEEE